MASPLSQALPPCLLHEEYDTLPANKPGVFYDCSSLASFLTCRVPLQVRVRRGHVAVVESVEDALKIVGVM